MKILIATTNQGKLEEMKEFLDDMPFDFLGLSDLENIPEEPEENQPDIEANAILKAKYYAEKTGLISIADDTGLFVDALDGWPGVKAARVGVDDDGRRETLLTEMKNIPKEKRGARFETVCACYDPNNRNIFISSGKVDGEILEEESEIKDNGFGYNPVFFVPENGKVFSEMTLQEKNSISQRGKALNKIKYFLQNNYGASHVVVPVAFIIKDSKLLITLRNDPHRPEAHKKWEFPGGICDFGETIETTVIKEAKEEVGYDVKVIKQLSKIKVKDHDFKTFRYQVYLIPVVCKIIGGELDLNSNETLDAKWIDLESHRDYDFLEGDNDYLDDLTLELKEIIKENNL